MIHMYYVHVQCLLVPCSSGPCRKRRLATVCSRVCTCMILYMRSISVEVLMCHSISTYVRSTYLHPSKSLAEALGHHVSRSWLNLEELKRRRLGWLMSCAKWVGGVRITSYGVHKTSCHSFSPLNEYQSYLCIIQVPTQPDTNYINNPELFSLGCRIGAIA